MGRAICLHQVLCLLLSFLHFRVISSSLSTQLCPLDQSLALLQFKNNFSINCYWFDFDPFFGFAPIPRYSKVVSWKEGVDCCSWDGVTCDRLTGHVIGLNLSDSCLYGTIHSNSSLFLLRHLRKLNLANNDFNFSSISPELGRFTSLQHLDLSWSVFDGLVPYEISLLSKLVSLDLSDNDLGIDQHIFKLIVQNLTEMKYLHLNSLNMSLVLPSSFLNLSSSLISLSLTDADLRGNFADNVFHLPYLQELSLSENYDLTGTFPKSNWSSSLWSLHLSFTSFSGELPASIGNLKSLKNLNLAHCEFTKSIPASLGNLTQITSMDLSFNNFIGPIPSSLSNLAQLTFLDLSENNFSGQIPNLFGNFSKITYLGLLDCNFIGPMPSSLSNLVQLTFLDLSYNKFSGQIPNLFGNFSRITDLILSGCNFSDPIPSSLSNLVQLTSLDLSYNNFSGQIPNLFGNFSKITYLRLSKNRFSGQLPSSAFNLTQLQDLDFSENKLEGPLPHQVSGLSNLTSLSLDYNLLSGRIPSWLFTLPSLQFLHLRNNKLTGPIDQFHQPNALEGVDLGNNEIQGSIPSSIFYLLNLTDLDLSSNNLSGIIELHMLSKLENLQNLDLSSNSLLSLRSSSSVNYTLPNLESLRISSCNIREFPNFLRTSENFLQLDLSNNQINGRLSKWELEGWDSLTYLDLSYNLLTGLEQLPGKNLVTLDLRSNLLEGPLLVPPPSIQTYFVQNNKLNGEIPSLICNLSSLGYLDLSNNSLSGMLPKCLGNFSNELSVLNLRMNNFNGSIPGTFAKGNRLSNLGLNGNQLEGPLPLSLVHCSALEVLDLGNNKINDTFPHWLDSLPELQVLILRSNGFRGHIGNLSSRFSFTKLRIIDLSHNEFTGPLPTRLFENLQAMMNADEQKGEEKYMGHGYYEDSVIVTMKRLEFKLSRILTIFTSIDLSSNRFQGRIPGIIGKFKSLIVLNLSHNSLIGHIPSSLETITALESLDLSCNKLDGKIPEQLTSLTFLEVLDLSQNQLVGPIPHGKQFDTFENYSYSGNSGLCGLPLSKKCSNDEAPQPPPSVSHEDEDSGSGFDWKITMMGYGCGLVFGLSMGYIVFSTGKPQWFVRLVEGDRHKKVRRISQRHQGRRN